MLPTQMVVGEDLTDGLGGESLTPRIVLRG
jgi:hypothetical protein